MNQKIKILLTGSNLWFLGQGLLGPLFAVYAERIGGDILDITWAWATYLIVAGLLYIITGKYSLKLSKEKVMVAGYFLNMISTFGFLYISHPVHLFIVQAGLGVAEALATPTWNALYAKYEDKKQDTYEWGMAGGQSSIITGVAIILGGFIVTYLSFDALFITMGIVQGIATIYQAKILFIK